MLKLNYTIKDTGLVVKDAIFKIMYPKLNYKQNNKYNIIISTCIWASEQARLDELKPIDENREYEFYLDSSIIESLPIHKACYEYLKTLPEFQDAVDFYAVS